MDIFVFGIGLFVLLVTALLGIIGQGRDMASTAIWAGFPGIGAIVGIYFAVALGGDGSLYSGTTLIASAASTADWSFIILVPIVLTVMCFGVCIWKISQVF